MEELSLEEIDCVADSQVGDPIPFSQPQFKRCAVRQLPIFHREDKVISTMVIHTATNSFYEIGRQLREAIYGQVNHGVILMPRDRTSFQRTNPQRHVAIKVYSIARLRAAQGKSQENPLSEFAAMQLIQSHDNLMTGIDYCVDAENLYCIMDYCDGGELFDVVVETGPQLEATARQFMRQILCGLSKLQSLGIMHRDLSLENILYSRTTQSCKIIDFGMSLLLPRDPHTQLPLLIRPQGICGKRSYMSPEIIENNAPYCGFRSDIWSMGVILFILLTGSAPVDIASPVDSRFRMISEGLLGAMLDQMQIRLSDEVTDLLMWMLQVIPSKRLSVAEILDHAWFKEE